MNKPVDEILGAVGFSVMTGRPGDTSVAMGLGDLPIIATSHLLNVMESACVAAIDEYLESGETTYLTHSAIENIEYAPMGVELRGSARLIDITGKELTFTCDVHDGDRHIATAILKRTAVERISFLARTAAQALLQEG